MPKRHRLEWFVMCAAKLLRWHCDNVNGGMYVGRHKILPRDDFLPFGCLWRSKQDRLLGRIWLRCATDQLHAIVL
jgi:hypothetical protein